MNPAKFSWLPVGFAVDETAKVRRLLSAGPGTEDPGYQIVDTQGRKHVCLLLHPRSAGAQVLDVARSLTGNPFREYEFGGEKFLAATYTSDFAPTRVCDIPAQKDLLTMQQLNELADCLLDIPAASWNESVFVRSEPACIPFGKMESQLERAVLAVRLLTGGVADPMLSPRQICSFNRWITTDEALEFLCRLGIRGNESKKHQRSEASSATVFELPGQPGIEALFKEKIIDYYSNRQAHERIGPISPPNGFLLAGPTGSGKTYAVEKLVAFLGWKLYRISLGLQGSSYIHETTKNIHNAFSKAIRSAPSVVFIDELEAIGASREHIRVADSHKAEEVTELLQQMDEVKEKDVVVLAATNLVHKVDDALKRSGRFEIIDVPYLDADGQFVVLEHCLARYQHEAGLDLRCIAKRMAYRPLSDIAKLVNDAAIIAVKARKPKIDKDCLCQAMPPPDNDDDPRDYIL